MLYSEYSLTDFSGIYKKNAEITDIFLCSGLTPRPKYTTFDDYAVMSMVEKGLGISILLSLILRRHAYHIAVKPLDVPAYRTIGVAMKSRKELSLAASRFPDFLDFLDYRQVLLYNEISKIITGSFMSVQYILIQILGFIGTIVFFASYQCKSSKNLFRVQFVSYLFYTIHLLLLGAFTGGISYCINILRSVFLGSSNKFLRSRWMCAILCAMQLAAMVFTWAGWLSVLPVAANIAATVGGYTHNGKKIRVAGMFINSPLWIIYNIAVGSWAGILDEVVSEASMIISVVRYGWKDLDKTEK